MPEAIAIKPRDDKFLFSFEVCKDLGFFLHFKTTGALAPHDVVTSGLQALKAKITKIQMSMPSK